MFEVRQTLKPGELGTRRLAARFPDRNPMVGVRIFYREDALREKAKSEGAIWRPRQKLWEMPLQTARRLRLGNWTVSGAPVRAVV